MLKYFKNSFFQLNNELPIIMHTNELKQKSNLIMRSLSAIETIQEKIDAGLIETIIGKLEWQKHFKNVKWAACEETESAITYLAKQNFPNMCKNIIGITGTNGKTSTTHFLMQLLCKMNKPNLLFNSNGIYINGELIEKTKNSTPSAYIIHKHLNSFTTQFGTNAFCIIETTSIGIAQKRIEQIQFTVSVFSNFSQDHLDYHKTIENYLQTKLKLAQYSKYFIVHNSIKQTKHTTFGNELISTKQENKLQVEYRIDQHIIKATPQMIGKFQANNILAAIVALKYFFDVDQLVPHLNSLTAPLARMQKIGQFIIDNSHTPDAIKNALNTLKEMAKGKVFIIAGAGGERDESKRVLIGNEMAKADYKIITNDNPRNEEPIKIAKQIQSGCPNSKIILSRKEAIQQAYSLMQKDDLCLVAGKGAETYQIFENGRKEFFSDIETIKKLYAPN